MGRSSASRVKVSASVNSPDMKCICAVSCDHAGRSIPADRVNVRIEYGEDGTTLTVRDHGPGAPVLVGSTAGYGLTGMRERAELLGGKLTAEPTTDGFLVELWLPR